MFSYDDVVFVTVSLGEYADDDVEVTFHLITGARVTIPMDEITFKVTIPIYAYIHNWPVYLS